MRTSLIKTKETDVVSQAKVLGATNDGKLDMVIAFDTTGSMDLYIKDVKKYVTDLVPRILDSNPNIRIGIVAFGDYCDMPDRGTGFGKAYQKLPLTNSKTKIINFIRDAKSTSGGDGDEFYELVIRKITEETNWRKGSNKVVLLIADANPHRVGYKYSTTVTSDIDWREEAKKSAAKGIKWDTIRIKPLEWMEALSSITNGIVVPFSKSRNTSHLIEAAAYARGGEVTKEVFRATMDSFKDDPEMSVVYASYNKILQK